MCIFGGAFDGLLGSSCDCGAHAMGHWQVEAQYDYYSEVERTIQAARAAVHAEYKREQRKRYLKWIDKIIRINGDWPSHHIQRAAAEYAQDFHVLG